MDYPRFKMFKAMLMSIAFLLPLAAGGAIPSIDGDTYILSLAPNGSILSLKNKKTQREILPIKANTPLWQIEFLDGTKLSSLDVNQSDILWQKKENSLILSYKHPDADVEAEIKDE